MGSVGIEKLHVLAVDDSLVDRKVVERLLKISCCKVTSVESGSRALEFLGLDGDTKMALDFQELKVNMIITDYSMPGMNGFELLKKIKGSSACKGIPVVIMSSENIMTRINSCLEEGAEDFLMKPLKLSDVERLRDFLMKGDCNSKASEMQPKVSPQVSFQSALPDLTVASPPPASINSPPAAAAAAAVAVAALSPSLPSLFVPSDLSCSLQHLSSPPSSPHWPSKRPRLLDSDK